MMSRDRFIRLVGPLLAVACAVACAIAAGGCVQGATHDMEGTGGASGPGMGGHDQRCRRQRRGRHGLGQRRQDWQRRRDRRGRRDR